MSPSPDHIPDHTLQHPDEIERLARQRAGRKLGWLIHLALFLGVNLLLAVIALTAGHPWRSGPLLGWALGLVIHGLVVALRNDGFGIHTHLVHTERERLLAPRQTWG